MVATVLRLRYRILGNTLVRRPWQLVGFCFGILGALWILILVVAGLVVAGLQDPAIGLVVVVLGGSALLLGWVLGPVLVTGADTTIDAARLAPFPLSRRQIMQILAGVGLTGVPGIVTSLAALATAAVWLRQPAAAVAAIPCAGLGVLTCVLASRLVTTLSAGLGGNRRGREVVGTVAILLVVLTGPILTGMFAVLADVTDLSARMSGIAQVLGWTPMAATWAVPADIAVGAWLPAILRLVIAVATVGALWLLWARALDTADSSPRQRKTRVVAPGSLGLFGVMPTGGVGATWARSLTAWLRDPRYLRQLLMVPLFPVLFGLTGGLDSPLFLASAVLVAFVLSIAGYTDVSYDGTAFASVLATGIRGRADRLGRILGAACVGVPLVVAVSVITPVLAGRADQIPAVLGASLGLLLVGYGVCAVSSALIATPVAAPGDSPFKTVPGQTFVSGLLVFVVLAACAVLASPALVLAVLSFLSGSVVQAWSTLAVGIAVGIGVLAAGVLLGGRTFDRTGPSLLARIKAFPTT